MTEGEWLASDDPAAMLRAVKPWATERKLRLFACACARLAWDLLPPGLLREVVEAGERAADGLISNDDRQAFIPRLYSPWGGHGVAAEGLTGGFAGRPWDEVSAFFAAKLAVAPGHSLAKLPAGLSWEEGARLTGPRQPAVLRDIFGPDPSRPPAFDPAWRTPDAVTLAGHVYYDRAFADLPALADLLTAAGCADEVILGHCRGEGPHVRGCWVADLVLGKA